MGNRVLVSDASGKVSVSPYTNDNLYGLSGWNLAWWTVADNFGYKINIAGGTFTGAVAGPYPTQPSHLATKQYVDDRGYTKTLIKEFTYINDSYTVTYKII